MKLFIRIKAAAVLLTAAIFTGCTFSSSIDSLLRAPMMNDEQEGIYSALTYYTGDNITLIYPKSGEYRSAYLMYDLDSDGTDEAIVFYEVSRTIGSDNSSMVRVNIIDRNDDGEWHSVYDHAGAGTTIERVLFTDFGESGKVRMVIGYGYLTPTEKTMRVYSYSDGVLNMEYSTPYYKTLIADLDRDGRDNIIVVNCNNENHQASAALISDRGNGITCTASVLLNAYTVDLPNIVFGSIGGDIPAIFIDGLLGSGYLATEVVYCVDGALRNPANISGAEITSATTRASGLYSMDIDGDGVVEIPSTEPFPGYQNSASVQNITNWNVFENYDIIRKYSSLTAAGDGYCFILPVRWEGLVTIKNDNTTGEKVFYKFNTNLNESRLELMRIITVDIAEEGAYFEKGYFTAASDERSCFMVRLGDTDDNLLLTSAEVINNFYLL